MPTKFEGITTWTSQEAFGGSDRSSSLHFWGRGAKCVASSFSDPRLRKLGSYTGYTWDCRSSLVENHRKSGPIKSTFTDIPMFQRFLRPEDFLWWGCYLRQAVGDCLDSYILAFVLHDRCAMHAWSAGLAVVQARALLEHVPKTNVFMCSWKSARLCACQGALLFRFLSCSGSSPRFLAGAGLPRRARTFGGIV